ncbi:MAG: hypothetical protein IGS23_14030 [Rivularia sp. T60_A2020_040]|nr:hypothetical protein [Rivularia sp. T60_A2020_040]
MKVHWSQLLYNKFRFGLHPRMFDEGGYEKKIVCSIEGERRTKQPYIVVFDKEYGLEYIRRTLISPLQPYHLETILDLVKDAQKKAD